MKHYLWLVFGIISLLSLPFATTASETIGSIEPDAHYVWSEQGGWINWLPFNGAVTITDSNVTGTIWSSHYGWINLTTTGSSPGISNDSNGHLSGFAWGENVGYIDFSSTTIEADGYFSGSAISTTTGRIFFTCEGNSACLAANTLRVRTDWRPASHRGANPSSPPSSSGGGTPYVPAPVLTAASTTLPDAIVSHETIVTTFGVTTTQPSVTLVFSPLAEAHTIAISSTNTFQDAFFIPFQTKITWDICRSTTYCSASTYPLYVKILSKQLETLKLFSILVRYQPAISEKIVIINTTGLPLETKLTFTRDLRSGLQGDDVRLLQQFLNLHGFSLGATGAGSLGQETTIFGPATAQALKKFQQQFRVEIGISKATGELDRLTRLFIEQRFYEPPSQVKLTAEPNTTLPFTINLSIGMTHAQVQNLQRYLHHQGFTVATVGPGSRGNESTYFGEKTKNALTRFQKKYQKEIYKELSIKTFGLLDGATRAYLNSHP